MEGKEKTSRQKKVAVNIVTLLGCVAGVSLSLAYMVVGFLSYFMKIAAEGVIKEVIAFMKERIIVECILYIIVLVLFFFFMWLLTQTIQNLLSEVKRKIKRRKRV